MKRVLITGSRNYEDYDSFCTVLDGHITDDTILISGGCTGADRLAARYAAERETPIRIYPADWSKGKSAGPLRNQQMVNSGVDLCLAFAPGKGTKDCIRRAEKANIPVLVF